MDKSSINNIQHKFWVTKQTVYRKLGKKDDECVVSSDASLDAKLELFKSIQSTSNSMNKLLDKYQERICYLAHVQNEFGRFLKEHGKADKSAAGKMMIQMGKSLIYSSQQEIALRPPLLRLYQEVETFRQRAVDDTLETIITMEKNRTEYRASLNWMKNVSQELDPDTYKQMEKFKKVQLRVKQSKGQFDKYKLACLQKVDLLAAARCNMFSHALILYQNSMSKITGKNERVFKTLANTFKGHLPYEFSFIKDLAEPSKRLGKEVGSIEPTEELLFDFGNDLVDEKKVSKTQNDDTDEDLLDSGAAGDKKSQQKKPQENGNPAATAAGDNTTTTDMLLQLTDDENRTADQVGSNLIEYEKQRQEDLLTSKNASELLENLLGPLDLSPEENSEFAELGLEALNLNLSSIPGSVPGTKQKENTFSSSSFSLGSTSSKKEKGGKGGENDLLIGDLLSEDFEGIPFDGIENDTMALLNEIMNVSNSLTSTTPTLTPQQTSSTSLKDPLLKNMPSTMMPHSKQDNNMTLVGAGGSNSHANEKKSNTCSFFPSQLLDLDNLNDSGDLLGFTTLKSTPGSGLTKSNSKEDKAPTSGANKSWYDIFADIDPLSNPDSIDNLIGKKKSDAEESENRYC